MEATIRSELSTELTRVIECPYPASLSKLEDLLTRADEVTIRSCIHDRPPCAVTRLATLICDALPLWAYTSDVLQLLCCSTEFAEKLLLQSPGLLNALLLKANASQRDFDDYLELCVRLLSRPLPECISLPASAQPFFLRVFERASKNPDVGTLKPVYSTDKLNNKLSNAHQTNRQLKDAYEKTSRDLAALQTTFSTLESKAQELDILCGEQEEELEELRTLRRNVLASMGLATQIPSAVRSAPRSQKDGMVPETPRDPQEHRRRKSAIQTQDVMLKVSTAAQGATNAAMDSVAEASHASPGQDAPNGSTPKRQKPRPTFKVPAMQTPFNQRPTLASRSASRKLSPVKRSALRQISPNRRHTTVGFAELRDADAQDQTEEPTSARKRRESFRSHSQEDFDMDDFLAGTPFTPGAFASGTGRLPDDDDATTTEL